VAGLTRQEAIERLEYGRRAVEQIVSRLTEDEMTRPATIGGGEWSAKDLLGHIAFWEELALEALADWRASRPFAIVKIFEAGQAGTDEANARNQETTRPMGLDEVLQRTNTSYEGMLGSIRSLSDDDWRTNISQDEGRQTALGELLGGVLAGAPEHGDFEHVLAHLEDLGEYVRSVHPAT
jgi:DinB superfamily